MSYPNVVYGDYGDEKITSASGTAAVRIGGLPLGTPMVLPDGREYVHAYTQANSVRVGRLAVQKAVAGTSINIAVAGTTADTIGSTDVRLTMPATTLVTIADQYAEGYLCIDNNTGEGYTYKIKASNTIAAAGTVTFTLYPNDPIKVALANGTTTCTIRENEFYAVIERAAGTTAVGIPAGVPNVSVAASTYCWLQRKGPATLLAGGTLMTRGEPFAACTVEASFQAWRPCTASGTTDADTILSPVHQQLGYTMVAPAASTDYFIGYLQLI